MITKRLKTAAFCLLLLCLPLSGCSDNDRKKRSASPATPQQPAAPGAPTSTGTVSQLTGDDDSEVDPATQQLVADAVARGDCDEPLDF